MSAAEQGMPIGQDGHGVRQKCRPWARLDGSGADQAIDLKRHMPHLKIAVSVVRLRPWAPFLFNDLVIADRMGANEFSTRVFHP